MKMTISKLAVRNLWRKRVRSVVILLSAALASGLIFSSISVLQSVRSSLEHMLRRLGADIMVAPQQYEGKMRKILLAGEPNSFYMDGSVLRRVTAVEGVEKASPQLFMTSSVLLCCSMPTVLLVGYDPESDFTLAPWIRYTHTIVKEQLDEVTVGAETLYATESAVMKFYGKQFKIGRSLHPTGMGFLDFSIFMNMDAARDMIEKSKTDSLQPLNVRPDQISSILVKVDQKFDIKAVAAEIEKSAQGVKAITVMEFITSVRRNIESALWTALAVGVLCWALMLAATGLAFALSVNEREREIGVLRAMGAKKRQVFGLIVSEASLLSGLGATTGATLSWILLANFRNLISATLGIPFSWQTPLHTAAMGALCVILVSLSGAVCAALPAAKTCRKEPYEAICQGMR